MWATDSIWFEIAIVSVVFALGNILFGHFEEEIPKVKRMAKYVLFLSIVVCLSIFVSRTISMIFLGLSLLPAVYIHTVLLPRKGINGWTGEPREKYYQLRGWDENKLYRPR